MSTIWAEDGAHMQFSQILQDKILKCPVCGEELSESDNGKSLYCSGAKRHCFDVAAKGYVNLSLSHSGGGDSKEAIRSRSAFLEKGFYRPFADKLCELLSEYVKEGLVIDAGCGEGYYTNLAAKTCGLTMLGFDLSKFGAEHGASVARREGIGNSAFAVASIYEMPVADGCADGVINLFAPCAEEEFKRVLKDGGILFVVGAGTDHLFGLKKAVYDEPYKNDPRNDLPVTMKHIGSHKVRFDITLSEREDRMALFAMTPYYYRTSRGDMEKLENAEGLVTEVEFDIEVYKK